MKYRAEYCQIVEDWRKSGLDRADYCSAHGYHPNTFDGWIKKVGRPAGQSKPTKNKVVGSNKINEAKSSIFVPLKIENLPVMAISPTFEFRYPNGVILSMSSLPNTEELSRIVHIYGSDLCSR
jgi:transposase-like protein